MSARKALETVLDARVAGEGVSECISQAVLQEVELTDLVPCWSSCTGTEAVVSYEVVREGTMVERPQEGSAAGVSERFQVLVRYDSDGDEVSVLEVYEVAVVGTRFRVSSWSLGQLVTPLSEAQMVVQDLLDALSRNDFGTAAQLLGGGSREFADRPDLAAIGVNETSIDQLSLALAEICANSCIGGEIVDVSPRTETVVIVTVASDTGQFELEVHPDEGSPYIVGVPYVS